MFLIRAIIFALGLSLGIWWVMSHHPATVPGAGQHQHDHPVTIR